MYNYFLTAQNISSKFISPAIHEASWDLQTYIQAELLLR